MRTLMILNPEVFQIEKGFILSGVHTGLHEGDNAEPPYFIRFWR